MRIYMYHFQTDNSLIEGIYQMVALLEHCKIKPIFVFDDHLLLRKQKRLKREKKKSKQLSENISVSDVLRNQDLMTIQVIWKQR